MIDPLRTRVGGVGAGTGTDGRGRARRVPDRGAEREAEQGDLNTAAVHVSLWGVRAGATSRVTART